MEIKNFILFFLLMVVVSHAQEEMSKADKYFYMYAYEEAIAEYNKDMRDGKLITNHQFLNLADSYFRTGDYTNASRIYLDINKRDTIIDNHRFNKMLQSLSKTSEKERIKAFLNTKGDLLANELMENAEFNFELLETTKDPQKFEIFNINGNSPQGDFSPSFYKDKLLFSSGRPVKSKRIYGPSGESYYDIYVARIGQNGDVLNPNVFDRMPNTKFHKSTPFYAKELDKIFYILSNAEGDKLSFDDNGKNSMAIGMVYENGFFSFLLRDLSTSFYYPFYDDSSGRLYFAANFEDGYGGTDIYYVSTNNGQIMSEPVNLGPRVNSPGNEIAPFIHDNSLYFSSDIFYGLGGMDIYKANTRLDGTFSIPINLGAGINSEKDEFGFIIRGDENLGFSGYFSSNRPGGKGNDDIYGFKIREYLGPKTFSLKGEVVEPKYQQGIINVAVRLMDTEGNLLKEFITKGNGKYQIEIPWRDNLIIEIKKDGHSSFYSSYNKGQLEDLQKSGLNVEMVSIDDIVTERESKNVLDVNDFFFARGKSDVTADIALELDNVIKMLRQFPQLKLQIETHTDSRGGSRTNKALSQKRADAVRNYLLQNGASSSNILSSTGYGEEKIMNSCTNGVYCLDFLHKQNLRTLFVIQNLDELK
ncbi:OmpA family protein [Maribacter algarum]|uniref:OmpA family protein n=1 Tax=Maribacter algarum (ex Zhang et al. 2020) TaxID=2578118 RepID=A0A5S3PTF1_9FLAO|nr:OmpA family protein [Maribacter algarum]TMM58233.1 OmpA family protein [Maribacter algarum]